MVNNHGGNLTLLKTKTDKSTICLPDFSVKAAGGEKNPPRFRCFYKILGSERLKAGVFYDES